MSDITSEQQSPRASISDLKSFNSLTGASPSHEVAGLYFYYHLDHLVDIGYAVAKDFSARRLHLFTSNSEENSLSLLRLCARMGNDEIFLSKEHRNELWNSLFGYGSDEVDGGTNNFPELRDSVLNAANRYVTHAEVETGGPALISNFRTVLIPFKLYLNGIQGSAVKLYRSKIFPELTEGNVYPNLRSSEVAAVYGINTPISQNWPYSFDANANKLIEEISSQLNVVDESGNKFTQTVESYLETAAKRGATVIASILDIDPDNSSDSSIVGLINQCFAWQTALSVLDMDKRSADTVARNASQMRAVSQRARARSMRSS